MSSDPIEVREPRFGERLRGIYASESNPHRDGMYVRTVNRAGRVNAGKFYELTDGRGSFWEYRAESVERLASLSTPKPESAEAVAWAVKGPMGETAHMGRVEPNLTEPGWSARPLVYGDTAPPRPEASAPPAEAQGGGEFDKVIEDALRCGTGMLRVEHVPQAEFTAPQQPSAPVEVIGDATQHLSKWLDLNECECDDSHQCGRAEVERTRDQLRALARSSNVSESGSIQAQPAADKFAATFRCESNGIVGTTNAPVHSVSMHDDGVIEVVIDHWPEQPAAVDAGWQVQLADALECFWNVALDGVREYDDSTANAVMSGMVQGVGAVATRLREHAGQQEEGEI